jgi:hypothetical protein
MRLWWTVYTLLFEWSDTKQGVRKRFSSRTKVSCWLAIIHANLLTGQRNKVTKWISDVSGGFETLIDTELDSNEPTDLPVWYDAL